MIASPTEAKLTLRELRSRALKMAAVIEWPTALKRRLLVCRSSSSVYPSCPPPFPSLYRLRRTGEHSHFAHVLNPPALISDPQIRRPLSIQELPVLQSETRSTCRVVFTTRRNTFHRSSGVNSDFPECATNHLTDADCTAGSICLQRRLPSQSQNCTDSCVCCCICCIKLFDSPGILLSAKRPSFKSLLDTYNKCTIDIFMFFTPCRLLPELSLSMVIDVQSLDLILCCFMYH